MKCRGCELLALECGRNEYYATCYVWINLDVLMYLF